MEFSQAIKTCLNKWSTFSGRAMRSEYWYFFLFTLVAQIVLSVVAAVLASALGNIGAIVGYGLFFIVVLWLFVASLAVTARRLHDLDKSAWWMLIVLVPVVGAIVFIYFMCIRGTEGPNRFDALAA